MKHSGPDVFKIIFWDDIIDVKKFKLDIVLLYCFHGPTMFPLNTKKNYI